VLVYLWGEPGCGKTCSVRDRWPEAFWLRESQAAWMGSYAGQGMKRLTALSYSTEAWLSSSSRYDRYRRFQRAIANQGPPAIVPASSLRREHQGNADVRGSHNRGASQQQAPRELVPYRKSSAARSLAFEVQQQGAPLAKRTRLSQSGFYRPTAGTRPNTKTTSTQSPDDHFNAHHP